jgi:ATP-dependent Clp protease protease subunit
MSPTSCIFIHNPLTIAFGDAEDMQKAIAMLGEVKESIINAYELKTNLSRAKISHLMDSETWMNANKAVELGFADGILYAGETAADSFAFAFSARAAANAFLNKITSEAVPPVSENRTSTEKPPAGVPKEQLIKRLNLLQH